MYVFVLVGFCLCARVYACVMCFAVLFVCACVLLLRLLSCVALCCCCFFTFYVCMFSVVPCFVRVCVFGVYVYVGLLFLSMCV